MKFFTFYSESHSFLLDLCIKSFLLNCDSDIHIRKIEQKCSGDYHSEGWKDSMFDKLQYILDSLNMCNEGEIMVHLDSDIIFNSGCEDYIRKIADKLDICFQWDSSGVCMGFLSCKKNSNSINFFTTLIETLDNFPDDQFCANHWISSEKFSSLKFGVFDARVYTYGMNGRMYCSDSDITLPKDWKVFHANFTPNLGLKKELLKKVYDANF